MSPPFSACASHDSRQMLSRGSGYGDTYDPRCSACGHVSITVRAVSSSEALTIGRRSQSATADPTAARLKVARRGGPCRISATASTDQGSAGAV